MGLILKGISVPVDRKPVSAPVANRTARPRMARSRGHRRGRSVSRLL